MATRTKVAAQPPAVLEQPLHLKYRPTRLKDVLGQDPVVKSLTQTLAGKNRPHCFLFTGPAGTGKTTLGRIVGADLGIDASGIIEVDAASHSGIDDVRRLTEGLRYSGFGTNPNKLLLLNECQGLSKAAWDALLTTTEEPPPHVYFVFTSTHPAKIPAAMVTRCQAFHLKALQFDDIMDVLEEVCEAEKFDTPGSVLKMVATMCGGSMRAALTMLQNVHGMTDLEEVAQVLQSPLEDKEVIELCRALIDRKLTWGKLTDTLKAMGDAAKEAESARIVICHYIAACMVGARSEGDAEDLYHLLDAFIKPFDTTTGKAPLLHAFGRVMFD